MKVIKITLRVIVCLVGLYISLIAIIAFITGGNMFGANPFSFTAFYSYILSLISVSLILAISIFLTFIITKFLEWVFSPVKK